jgi:hypothetical protein
MNGRPWQVIGYASIFLLGVLLLTGFIRYEGSAAGPGPTTTPIPLLTVSMSCTQARDAIQVALDAYHTEKGKWPTADGQPGDIEWSKFVPDYMEGVPSNDSKCDWGVNGDPEGKVCLQHIC